MSSAAPDFVAQLERYYSPATFTRVVRRNLGLGTVEDVEDAFQKVLVATYARYADGSVPRPDNLDAYIQRSIRNALIDGIGVKARDAATGFGADAEAWDDLIEDNAWAGFCGRSVLAEDALSWKQTYAAVLERLPPKWVEVATMAMSGRTPKEIGDRFGQDGYKLRAYARKQIAKVFAMLAAEGDENCAVLMRSFQL